MTTTQATVRRLRTRKPRTPQPSDRQMLCALDCGRPPMECDCLIGLLTDRNLALPGPDACPLCGGTLAPEADGCAAIDCQSRVAQADAQLTPRPAPIEAARASSAAARMWQRITRAIAGARP